MVDRKREQDFNEELGSKLAALLTTSAVDVQGHTDDDGVRITLAIPKDRPGTFRESGKASQELMALLVERNL